MAILSIDSIVVRKRCLIVPASIVTAKYGENDSIEESDSPFGPLVGSCQAETSRCAGSFRESHVAHRSYRRIPGMLCKRRFNDEW